MLERSAWFKNERTMELKDSTACNTVKNVYSYLEYPTSQVQDISIIVIHYEVTFPVRHSTDNNQKRSYTTKQSIFG